MAKLKDIPKWTGTRGDITVYQLFNNFYCRSKSSLDGERVKTDKAFERTMENAGVLAKASKIASTIYRALPPAKKEHGNYRIITGAVMKLTKMGCTEEEIVKRQLEIYS